MISSIIDLILLTALGATSFCVLLMYRRLRRFDVLQGDAAKAFARSADALEKARAAFGALHTEGDHLTVSMASRLNEARMLLNDIEDATAKSNATMRASAAAEESLRAAHAAWEKAALRAASTPVTAQPSVQPLQASADRTTASAEAAPPAPTPLADRLKAAAGVTHTGTASDEALTRPLETAPTPMPAPGSEAPRGGPALPDAPLAPPSPPLERQPSPTYAEAAQDRAAAVHAPAGGEQDDPAPTRKPVPWSPPTAPRPAMAAARKAGAVPVRTRPVSWHALSSAAHRLA